MNTPLTYSSVLSIVRSWPPGQRLHLLQDVMETLAPSELRDARVASSATPTAADVRAALMEYSAGHVYEISDASDLARLIRDADDDSTYQPQTGE